ncbi:UNVERIFIED_CONTAM: hypothetical protein FKN15_045479 [Acipenser sinensis]
MNTRCPPKRVPSAVCFFTHCKLTMQPPRATASEDNAVLVSLQASPQAHGQTTGVTGAWLVVCFAHRLEDSTIGGNRKLAFLGEARICTYAERLYCDELRRRQRLDKPGHWADRGDEFWAHGAQRYNTSAQCRTLRYDVGQDWVPRLYVLQGQDTLCAQCLGIQHATLAPEREVACSICASFQPRVKENSSNTAPTTVPSFPRGDQGEQEETSQLAQEDTLSIVASWDAASFSSGMEVGGEPKPPPEAEPSFKVASEASTQPLSDSTLSLMECAAVFLQVPWTPAAEPCWSIFQTQVVAPCPQKFPAFPDFMEEVRSSWDHPASAPSVLKQVAQLASLEDVEKLGLVGLPPVDSNITALVKALLVGGLARDPACPNLQCRVTEMHLKRAYAAEAQVTRLANTAGILTAYMDAVLHKVPLPEPMATEICLLSRTLIQISGLQGQALGRRAWLA